MIDHGHRAGTRSGPRRGRCALLGTLAALVTVGVLLAGCVGATPARPVGASVTAGPVTATGPDDDVTAITAALQDYWRSAFPAEFGRPWTEIRTFSPVHPMTVGAPAPPCVAHAADVRGNAYYCPAADAVVWDADELAPRLRDRYGTPGLVIVLAHEVGHAVQSRLGVDEAQRADPAGHPTILLETAADCFAGAALRHLVDRGATGTPAIGPVDRDTALQALVGFSDPLGTVAADAAAHGNAFDRISAIADGYTDGPTRCAGMTLDNRRFTERDFGSAADRARGGNLPVDRLLDAVAVDARAWFSQVVTERRPGAGWRAPGLRTDPGTARCSGPELRRQGPARYCAADGTLLVDRAGIAALQAVHGDFGGATLVAARYGLAALGALGRPTSGPDAGRAAVCLAGAYTARLVDPAGPFGLSPGDLDEAVQILLTTDDAARDATGTADPADHGFDRIQHYRVGFLGGPASCGI